MPKSRLTFSGNITNNWRLLGQVKIEVDWFRCLKQAKLS